jgi:hypothetical protein
MSNPSFKMSSSWEDLRPIHPLFVTLVSFQVLGAIAGFLLQAGPSWFESAWLGGALATFPGFLAGIPVQARLRPGSLALHKSTVIFLGAMALVMSVVAVTSPWASSGAP